MCFIICRTCVPPLLLSFLFLTFCGSSLMCWDLLLTCRVAEIPIDVFVLWLWLAPVGCSGNLAYALCLDGSLRVVLIYVGPIRQESTEQCM
jgi:hypothetical protein